MIKFALLLFILAPSLSLAQAVEPSVAASSAQALLSEIKVNTTIKIAAVEVLENEDEAAAIVRWQNPQNQVIDAHFDCHGDHCHGLDQNVNTVIPAQALNFETSALINSLSQAFDIYQRKVASLETVTGVKLWQAGSEIYITLSQKAAAGLLKSHFMCHVHGGHEFDCHRGKNPGPQEPQF